ncbi:hypothetical protein KDA_49260 [Dictyobacter alpinus]|uniref:OmpR/PhoB-type domain-containing protein n=1 Tax=Dictyobacter alpinus TaxID=2014873 RepID=A0A402BDS7_9CHLR|nr:hypothetical protein [Dictyobacter alpinus]GCE29442.1 hypothetical protein KDA_49260 [Dictyobacter alpinus]
MASLTRRERYPAGSNAMMPFRLTSLLEPDHVLFFNPKLGTLSHVAPGPEFLEEQQFTVSELCLLIPLLESYPHYCPYEQLLASFERGRQASQEDIERSRLRLQTAEYEGLWDEYIRPLRGSLSRARLKLRRFGIDVVAVTVTGYMLKRFPYASSQEGVDQGRFHAFV